MCRRSWLAAAAAVALVGAAPAAANAQLLGSVTVPAGVYVSPCIATPSVVYAQIASDPATPYVVPADGKITKWETNQSGSTAPPGSQLGFEVLRSTTTTGVYDVVGADVETLPATLPANGIVTFPIANPIKVNAGDVIGLWSLGTGAQPLCVFGTPPGADNVGVLAPVAGFPGPGTTLTVAVSGNGGLLDLAATFVPRVEDAGITATTGPPNAIAGLPAILASSVTNNGPDDDQPITFTDIVPPRLTIDSAFSGSGACTTAGQIVTCTISGLAPGQSAPVQVLVTPAAAGSYQNSVSVGVASNATDPNPANNSASAVLSVAPVPSATSATVAAPVAHCVVPVLNRVPASFARRVLGLLGCRVGSVRQVHSKTVAKGEVIRSTPGAGTYTAARVVSLLVSSGRAKPHR